MLFTARAFTIALGTAFPGTVLGVGTLAAMEAFYPSALARLVLRGQRS